MPRNTRWTILTAPILLAVPSLASAGQLQTSNDCYDTAAPMADATPCVVPDHTRPKHHRHDRQDSPRPIATAPASSDHDSGRKPQLS